MPGEAAIHTRGLKKAYGAFEAVRGIDFDVERASCTGLLGPNGAGKTTIMRMIMGLTRVTAGELRVFGVPVGRITRREKARIGLVPQDSNLDPNLSVRQSLEVYGSYFGLPHRLLAERVPELLAFMQLTEKVASPVMQLSSGMRRRLVFARALIADPELVILDEPTTGLDPQARVLIWRQLLELRRQGRTLLLTTHYMDEAQRLCDHIVVIDGGRILDEGTPGELIARHAKGHVYELPKPLPPALSDGELEREDTGDSVLFYVEVPDAIRPHLPRDGSYLHRPANMEDVFLRLTGRQLRET